MKLKFIHLHEENLNKSYFYYDNPKNKSKLCGIYFNNYYFIIIIIDMNNYFLSENKKAIFSGSVAGAVGYCSTLPLDYIKQHMQNNKSFSSIIQNTKLRYYFNGGLIGINNYSTTNGYKIFLFS